MLNIIKIRYVLFLLDLSAEQGGPSIKQTPATPTSSVAGSDTKSGKAKTAERKGSAARKSGKGHSNINYCNN